MKATEKEIRDYCYALYMVLDLDWYGYLKIRQYEKECLLRGGILKL